MLENKKEEIIKLGRYRHFKGDEYQVLGTALHSETKEELAVYQSLNNNQTLWVRPKRMFLSEVEEGGVKKKRFELLEEDSRSLEDKYKRALADYQNLLKQTAQEKQEFARYANENILESIIPIYNNLKLSLKHSQGASDKWLEGVKYVTKQFKDALESFGVAEIQTSGQKFNPETMEALEGFGEMVAEEVSPGYVLNGRVIIPAKVIVGKEYKGL